METDLLLREKLAKLIKEEVNETYALYVRFNISLEGLNEKEWKEREVRRVLDTLKYSLKDY